MGTQSLSAHTFPRNLHQAYTMIDTSCANQQLVMKFCALKDRFDPSPLPTQPLTPVLQDLDQGSRLALADVLLHCIISYDIVTASRQQMCTLEHLFLMFFDFKLAFQEMSHSVACW